MTISIFELVMSINPINPVPLCGGRRTAGSGRGLGFDISERDPSDRWAWRRGGGGSVGVGGGSAG